MMDKKGLAKKWIFLIILLVLIAGFFIFVFYPTAPDQTPEPDVNNTRIYSLLIAAGINESFVDVNSGRATIVYDLPEGMDKEASWFYAMGVVAGAAPHVNRILVQARVGGQLTELVISDMGNIQDFMTGNISEAEFRSRLEIRPSGED